MRKTNLLTLAILCAFNLATYAQEASLTHHFDQVIDRVNKQENPEQALVVIHLESIMTSPVMQGDLQKHAEEFNKEMQTAYATQQAAEQNNTPLTAHEQEQMQEKLQRKFHTFMDPFVEQMSLADKVIVKKIQQLQKQKAKVIAITSLPYDVVDNIIEHLKKFGIDFAVNSLSNEEMMLVAQTKNAGQKNKLMLAGINKGGIVFSHPDSFELALQDLVAQTEFKPASVVFLGNTQEENQN